MHRKSKIILRLVKRKNHCYSPSLLTAFTLFCLIYVISGNNLFSQGLSNQSGGSSLGSSGLGGFESSKKGPAVSSEASAGKGEYINYFNDADENELLRSYSNVPIKHISDGIDFEEEWNFFIKKKNLTVDQYQILIKDMISKKYPDLNVNSAVSKFFFRALAENTYSLDGYLPADKFNSIVDARETFFKINSYIDALDISNEIKRPMKELFVYACIYAQKIDLSIKTLQKLKRIPPGCILYELKNYSGKIVFGQYATDRPGENLYYICSAFYNKFTELPHKKQLEALDYIYSFNPTLQLAPPIVSRYNFVYWIASILPFSEKPNLLKYCVRGNIGWLLLPKTIHFK